MQHLLKWSPATSTPISEDDLALLAAMRHFRAGVTEIAAHYNVCSALTYFPPQPDYKEQLEVFRVRISWEASPFVADF